VVSSATVEATAASVAHLGSKQLVVSHLDHLYTYAKALFDSGRYDDARLQLTYYNVLVCGWCGGHAPSDG
jgi:hypothetical protein